MHEPLVSIRGLKTYFFNKQSTLRAVDGLNLDIRKSEIIGVAGESGSGKTIMALSILRLVPFPGRIIDGKIIFAGVGDLTKLSEKKMEAVRGKKISMSFQDPLVFLDPLMKVGEQITEAIRRHQGSTTSEAKKIAVELMDTVCITAPEVRFKAYPHQLSGGMRQRVLIAIALSCRPELLILDEPTTALDVITQDEILNLIKRLRNQLNTTTMLITHDLGILAELCDRVAIMYGGKLMEVAPTKEIFKGSGHPYTKALMEAIPRIDVKKERIRGIDGNVPDLSNPPEGCMFNPRCSHVSEKCCLESPPLERIGDDHWSACFYSKEVKESASKPAE